LNLLYNLIIISNKIRKIFIRGSSLNRHFLCKNKHIKKDVRTILLTYIIISTKTLLKLHDTYSSTHRNNMKSNKVMIAYYNKNVNDILLH